jgi:hypothetical protein
VSRGIPDRSFGVHRSGPTLQVADPTPATVFTLTWSSGSRPRATDRLSMNLSDVGGLTVDGARAGLSCPTVSVRSDGPATLRFTSLRKNALVTGGESTGRTGPTGAVAVRVAAGKTTVRVCAAAAGGGGGSTPASSGSDGGGGALAATGDGAALPVTALVLLASAGLIGRRRHYF